MNLKPKYQPRFALAAAMGVCAATVVVLLLMTTLGSAGPVILTVITVAAMR